MAPQAAASKKSDKFITMTTSPVEKLVLKLAIPSIVIMLITSIYNMADTYFVSSLGTSQVAAVGVAFPLMAVVQAMGFFFGQGSGNFMARALGAQNTESASRMAATGFVSGFCIMALIAIPCLIGLDPLVGALGATPTIRPFAEDYLFYILLASPWMVAATIINQHLRFQGSASIAMVGMLIGGVLNIFLDPLFIFAFNMGIKGAALATMISQIVSFVILLFYGTTRKGNVPMNLRHFSPSLSRYIEMFKGGIPAFLRQALMSVATIVINHSAGIHGDAAIAAISIVNRLCMFATSAMLGFGQGFQPVCGFNYGAKLYSRVRKSFWFCIKFCCVSLLSVAIIFIIFAPFIISLFRKDDLAVIEIGARGLRLCCITLPFMAVVILANMMTQTMGKALQASVIALSRQGLFLIPLLFLFGPLFGLWGLQIAVPVSDMAGFCVVIPLLIKEMKHLSAPDAIIPAETPAIRAESADID